MKVTFSVRRFVWPSAVAVVIAFTQFTAAQPAVPAAEAAPEFFHYSVSSGSAVIPGVQVSAARRKSHLPACMHVMHVLLTPDLSTRVDRSSSSSGIFRKSPYPKKWPFLITSVVTSQIVYPAVVGVPRGSYAVHSCSSDAGACAAESSTRERGPQDCLDAGCKLLRTTASAPIDPAALYW